MYDDAVSQLQKMRIQLDLGSSRLFAVSDQCVLLGTGSSCTQLLLQPCTTCIAVANSYSNTGTISTILGTYPQNTTTGTFPKSYNKSTCELYASEFYAAVGALPNAIRNGAPYTWYNISGFDILRTAASTLTPYGQCTAKRAACGDAHSFLPSDSSTFVSQDGLEPSALKLPPAPALSSSVHVQCETCHPKHSSEDAAAFYSTTDEAAAGGKWTAGLAVVAMGVFAAVSFKKGRRGVARVVKGGYGATDSAEALLPVV